MAFSPTVSLRRLARAEGKLISNPNIVKISQIGESELSILYSVPRGGLLAWRDRMESTVIPPRSRNLNRRVTANTFLLRQKVASLIFVCIAGRGRLDGGGISWKI